MLAIAVVVSYAGLQLLKRRRRLRLGLEPGPGAARRVAGHASSRSSPIAVILVTNADRGTLVPIRGLPFVVVLVLFATVVLSFVASRTGFGRHVYAVGGHAEAARRAGIKVQSVRVGVFMISGVMSAVGGIVLASRLQDVVGTQGGGQLLLYAIAAAVVGGTSPVRRARPGGQRGARWSRRGRDRQRHGPARPQHRQQEHLHRRGADRGRHGGLA